MDTLFGLLGLVALLFGFLFWLWMLVDCATKESSEGNTKVVWIIIIVFTYIIGALLYCVVRRPQRYAAMQDRGRQVTIQQFGTATRHPTRVKT
jgi:hypothetical protein